MVYEYILLIISFLVFTGYIIAIWTSCGILKSISYSYYYLNGNAKWLFTIFMWILALPIMIVGSTGFMFFAGAGICFAGAAPAFKDESMEERVHIVGAVSGILLGMMSMWKDFGYSWIPVTFVCWSILIMRFVKKTYIWWIEILAFYLIFIGLYLKISGN